MKSGAGVKRMSVPEIETVPPTAEPTAVIVSDWPDSLAGPAESLPVSVAKAIVRVPESSATDESASSDAVGP